MSDILFKDPKVAAVFDGFPKKHRDAFMQIRHLIFDIAAQDSKIGAVTESLRWGQPAYLTLQSKSGSTLRLGQPKTGGYAVFTHCQSSLMSDFRTVAPNLNYDGNRAVLFASHEKPPLDALAILIQNALTYHL